MSTDDTAALERDLAAARDRIAALERELQRVRADLAASEADGRICATALLVAGGGLR